MNKSPIAENFKNFLLAMQDTNKTDLPEDVSFQIFYDLFKIREAQWEYSKNFRREIDFSLADIFQDIIAHYLKRLLPTKYEIILEYKQNKKRPDILIKKDGKPCSVIEIKTTIGWNRDLVKGENYLGRLKELSEEFKVPINKVFYIFEASRNVNKEFFEFFKRDSKEKIKEYIFPLFEHSASPYYFSKRSSKKEFNNYSSEEIYSLYLKNKITSFDKILQKIK